MEIPIPFSASISLLPPPLPPFKKSNKPFYSFDSFSLSYEEGSILIVEYNNIYIFCYKPKSLDLTLPKILPSFSKLKLLDIKTAAEGIITISKHCFDQEEYIKYFIASVALIA